MNDAYMWWLALVGGSLTVAAGWLLLGRLGRGEDDVSAAERVAEAEWIGGTIERHGGIAPVELVEEILDLHQVYLQDARLAQPPSEDLEDPVAARPGRAYPPAAGYPPAADYPPAAGYPPRSRTDGTPQAPLPGPPTGRPPHR